MPRHKDFKRLVRARMQKTGEAYTTARAQIVRRKTRPATPSASAEIVAPSAREVGAAGAAPSPSQYAALAGMSDATVKAKTGCTWEKWVKSLDHYGAASMSHREIAELVHTKYKIPGWWAQTVTVGYERIRGLRDRGQRRDGGYEAGKSRTYNVPVRKLFDVWHSPTTRRRFLDGAAVKVRTANPPKSMRLQMENGSVVALWFTAKGDSKAAVSVQHLDLPDRAAVDRSKQFWSERLDALAGLLHK